MGEVQEQRYICKICNKICVSGKSLGGHMRVHLAQISASKKAAKEKAAIKTDDDQYNNAPLSEEKIKDYDSNTDFGDGDQNNYQLRENPKKSWRVSDPKRGASKNWNSCRECGKEFSSLKALSGHMRCHSIKNKEVHHCEKCGKGFGSIRAMFGHMKFHSKKLRTPNDSADSLSDLENLCPVRRKRSRIGYKSSPNPSFSDLNASDSGVSELGEVNEAATCLIMLSRGVCDSLKFETESSNDDYAYYGAESSCRSQKFFVYNGDFQSDVKKKMSISTGMLVCCSAGYAKAFTEKNVSEFDDLVSEFVAEDQRNVDTEVSDDELLSVENEIKIDFDQVLKPEKSYKFDDSRTSNSTKSAELGEDFLVATGKKEGSSKFLKSNYDMKAFSSVHESCFENEANLESTSEDAVSLESSKSKDYECLVCFKVFSSGQALGGHKRAHYGFTDSKKKEAMVMTREVAETHDVLDLNYPVTVDEGIKTNVGFNPWWIDRSREHEALVLTN